MIEEYQSPDRNPVTGIPYINPFTLRIKKIIESDSEFLSRGGYGGILEKDLWNIVEKKRELSKIVIDFFSEVLGELKNVPSLRDKIYRGKKIGEMTLDEILEMSKNQSKKTFEVVTSFQVDIVNQILEGVTSPPSDEGFQDFLKSISKSTPLTKDMKNLVKFGSRLGSFVEFLEIPLIRQDYPKKSAIILKTEKTIKNIENFDSKQQERERLLEDLEYYKSPFYNEKGYFFSQALPRTLKKESLPFDVTKIHKVCEALENIGKYVYFFKSFH